MSYFLLDAEVVVPNRPAAAKQPVLAPAVPSQASRLDRRRPGRIENASAELIALMRKPSHVARLQMELYDAPGFLPKAEKRPLLTGRCSGTRVAAASAACFMVTAAAFGGMLMLWG